MTIRSRLENWARWSTWTTYSGPDCMTGAVCERLRRAALGNVYSGMNPRPDLDENDAELVERAWRAQTPKHKAILRWSYVRNASPDFICRRLGIRPRPSSIFAIEMTKAEQAIAKTLDTMLERNKIPDNNLIPSMTSDSTKGVASPENEKALP